VVIGEIKRLWQGIAEGMIWSIRLSSPRARSKPRTSDQYPQACAKDLKLIIVVNYIPAGLALKAMRVKRSPPGQNTLRCHIHGNKKTSHDCNSAVTP